MSCHCLLYRGALFGVEAFAFGTIAVHGLVVTKTSHRVTPFFVFDALEFFVLRTAEFAFLTPETDVEDESFSIFEHSLICFTCLLLLI